MLQLGYQSITHYIVPAVMAIPTAAILVACFYPFWSAAFQMDDLIRKHGLREGWRRANLNADELAAIVAEEDPLRETLEEQLEIIA